MGETCIVLKFPVSLFSRAMSSHFVTDPVVWEGQFVTTAPSVDCLGSLQHFNKYNKGILVHLIVNLEEPSALKSWEEVLCNFKGIRRSISEQGHT